MNEPYLINHYLERAASINSEAEAVVDRDRSLTYGQLLEESVSLASTLASLGVSKGDRVGIYMAKSIEAVVSIYGILQAGAVYVPLDPGAPPKRVSFIAKDCGIRVLLSETKKASAWDKMVSAGAQLEHVVVMNGGSDVEVPGVEVHTFRAEAKAEPDIPAPGTIEDDLAFILYTSGSTGDPKGVMLSHRNCRGFVEWAVDEYAVTSEDRLSSHAPLHFDLSTFDLYAAAAAGAPVILVPPSVSVFPVEVARFIEKNEITVWYSVPSILALVTEHAGLEVGALPKLRTVLFAGEVFPTKHLSRLMRLLPHVSFANLFGPTETNVCTAYLVPGPPDETAPPISIGGAISNVETFVVTDDGNQAPPGVIGELYVRGPTVMKGYWGDPGRTSEKLIPSPLGDHLGDLVYRTGDLVEEKPDGNYRFLGRRDNQIKSRGYRIELGDIETVVGQHPAVFECGVVAIPDEMISNRIECFVSANAEVDEAELTRFCADSLPKYMIPERFIIVDSLPKTSTGKIDRRALMERTEPQTAQ